MKWKCNNCGKQVEFSAEQLAETRGVVVCPQCLSSEQIPGYGRPKTKQAAVPQGKGNSGAAASALRATPPPHRKKITFTDTSESSAPASAATPPEHKPKKKSGKGGSKKKKKARQRGCLAPMSAWGCLWRTVVFTLALLLAYIFVGLLLQGV